MHWPALVVDTVLTGPVPTCAPCELTFPLPHPLTPPTPTPSHPAQVLGAKRKNLAGFSSTTAQPHQGFIFASDIIQQTPPSLRPKAARLVGAKCTLLARVDAFGQVGCQRAARRGYARGARAPACLACRQRGSFASLLLCAAALQLPTHDAWAPALCRTPAAPRGAT